ncbi:hypothetical protein HDU98_009471 [Podochytrium sp. JEL0797]|nr:hypothetical protein HDU98_009471 [Podochytrium sp. JEL0797]
MQSNRATRHTLKQRLLKTRSPPILEPVTTITQHLKCPINWSMFEDPVIDSEGQTYERSALTSWINKFHNELPLSPVSGERLPSRAVTPNLVIASLVSEWTDILETSKHDDPLKDLMHLTKCPLSRVAFVDPVVAADGHSYERREIELFFRTRSHVSPVTKMPMYSGVLVPNISLLRFMHVLKGISGVQLKEGVRKSSVDKVVNGLRDL